MWALRARFKHHSRLDDIKRGRNPRGGTACDIGTLRYIIYRTATPLVFVCRIFSRNSKSESNSAVEAVRHIPFFEHEQSNLEFAFLQQPRPGLDNDFLGSQLVSSPPGGLHQLILDGSIPVYCKSLQF